MTSSPLARQQRSLANVTRLFAGASQQAALFQDGPLLASIVPAVPHDPFPQLATSDAPPTPGQLSRLADRYHQAGIREWSFWADAADTTTAATLMACGYRPVEHDPGMSLDLDGWEPGDRKTRHRWDVSTLPQAFIEVGALNQLARPASRGIAAAFGTIPDDMRHQVRIFLAYRDRQATPVAGLLTIDDQEGDCAIHFVATDPQAQRNGYASTLLNAALLDARRDCQTASLQAEATGIPLYERLGFRQGPWFNVYRCTANPI